jgi:hypothetical protein
MSRLFVSPVSKRRLSVCLVLTCLFGRTPFAIGETPAADAPVVWKLDRLDSVGGHKTVVLGKPRVIDTPHGKAIEFDGKADGLFIESNPLAGLKEFTAEVVFRPDLDGLKEQRFIHIQEARTENRLMFETRLTDDKQWFLDTFIKSGEGDFTLFAEKSRHPIDGWYHAAVVVDGRTMRHFVNGREELSVPIEYQPQTSGRTSIGVRQNKVHWFKGAIRQMRFAPRALSPREFLQP